MGLLEAVSCLALSLCETRMGHLNEKAAEGRRLRTSSIGPQPSAHQAPLGHTREKVPEPAVVSKSCQDPVALSPPAPLMLSSLLATELVASAMGMGVSQLGWW